MKILKEQMGLIVVPGGEVTSEGEVSDGQVYGKIYFSPTAINFQCPTTKKTKTVKVPRGTVAIEPAAMSLNNQGFLNNTLCHEGFHWFRHSSISFRTVAAFCVGIGANMDTANKLLAAAGLAVYNSKEIHAYRFVIHAMRGRSIKDCNVFLERMGFEPLGAGEGSPKKSVKRVKEYDTAEIGKSIK